MPHAALWVVQRMSGTHYFRLSLFQCRTRLCGWCSQLDQKGSFLWKSFNAARGFVGGAAPTTTSPISCSLGFNAARGFVGGAARGIPSSNMRMMLFQCRTRLCGWCSIDQEEESVNDVRGFNAARGFVGGAAMFRERGHIRTSSFQCRTRLCGWCSFVARSPFPPREKKPFWKVSGNLRCLTENM